MTETEIDIILKAKDEASDTFRKVSNSADEMGEELKEAADSGSEGFDKLDGEADKAKEGMEQLGDETEKTKEEVEGLGKSGETSGAELQLAFSNIADGVMRAKEGVVELGRNLMETLSLAGQQEQQETFLKMNIGAEGAAKQMKVINDLVADLPGDDVAIGGILSQAAAKNAGITADELKRMGTNAADYFAAMSNYGKSSIEAQQDLTNYILTGNTAELERSPVLQAHIDKLKEAQTVEERNKALQEAMNEEGWSGISQQETYNNKLETFTAMLDRGKRQMGEMFLSAAGGLMDFVGDIDTATGGIIGMGIAIGTVVGGPMIDIVTGFGQMASGINAFRTAMEGTAIANAIAEGSFWSLAASELAAAWPILAIVAALAVLGVAIYELGKYFGWWTDVGSMIDAISAGIQRLWSAFINHPDVQGFLQGLSAAWSALQPFINNVVNAVLSFFNIQSSSNFDFVRALIDALGLAWQATTLPIRLVIQVIRLLWNNMKTAGNNIHNTINNIRNWFAQLPGRIRSAISTLVSVITQPFRNAYNGVTKAVDDIKSYVQRLTNLNLGSITDAITKPFRDAYQSVCDWVDKIKKKAQEAANNPLSVIGLGFDYEGMMQELQSTGNINKEETIRLEQEISLIFDLKNVPEGTDEDVIYGMISQLANDKNFVKELTGNPDFQNADAKVKNRIIRRQSRMIGGGI